MKIFKSRYPKGTFKGQKTDGRFIDGFLYENLRVYAKAIVRDMTFLGFISSSTLEVGTGKSCFVQQLGEAWEGLMWEEHKIKRPLELEAIVFKPEDLMDTSKKIPQYSVIILDEWEDSHYWSKLGITLRQFFRKCRQLNLFMICIIPNFFELPRGYAVSRSAFFIDVCFRDGFERGLFKFYSFPTKKRLYHKGKKEMDYGVVKPDFMGDFGDGYVVGREEYLEKKRKDLEGTEELIKPNEVKKNVFLELFPLLKGFGATTAQLSRAFGVSDRTIARWKAPEPNRSLLDCLPTPIIPTPLENKNYMVEEPS